MGTKDYVTQLLKRLEEGTNAIFARYEKMLKESGASYKNKKKAIQEDYVASANQVAAQTRIDLKNTLEKMADSGLVHTGEGVQAEIASNADRNRALAGLAIQKAKDISELDASYWKADQELRNEAEREAQKLEDQHLELIREQENADREYALKQEELNWKKEQAQENKTETNSQGITPSRSPYDYLKDIEENNTRYDRDMGYRVLDRKAVNEALNRFLHDKNVSVAYRYELYLYAQSQGYFNL